MNKKRAVFFSTDALIALILIFLSILIIYPLITNIQEENFIQEDILKSLSSLKIGEINNSLVKSLIASSKITDLNKSVLEQIGEFYITDTTTAKQLMSSILPDIEESENIGVWYGSTLIYSKNKTSFEDAKYIDVERQLISGIKEGESVTGFSSRAYLQNSLKTKYFYFGGYTGEGNISLLIDYIGELNDIKIEITTNTDFDIYINNKFSGHYAKSISDFQPKEYSIGAYKSYFEEGENLIKFAGDNLHVSGGYIKIIYSNEEVETNSKKYYFPGIKGLINIYDGFYVPENLNQMEVYLHYDANHTLFLNIGNTTIFNETNDGETIRIINNAELSEKLNYNDLSKKTIPLRLGLENASYLISAKKDIDVFSVTDLSGSMCGTCSGATFWCCLFAGGCYNNQPGCETCGGTCNGGIYPSKNANIMFINQLLNSTENRVGLAGYKNNVNQNYFHNLSNNNVSLINKVNEWTAVGSTCICCGINKAVSELAIDSNSSKFMSIVVMSDGEANIRCPEQGTGNAKTDAILASCQAYQDYGIKVFSVGFGPSADTSTLQSIANCGNGSYYYSDISNIVEVYEEIAEELFDASYKEQTIVSSANILTELYPDSYIEFYYNEDNPPYGLLFTSEKKFDTAYEGVFSIPENSTIYETKVISYSGARWTNNLKINNISSYNLSEYGIEFIKLGDPYSINIANENINQTNNNIWLTTAISPDNFTEGSLYNKMIYTVRKNITSYSSISSIAEGCFWNISFEDDSYLETNIPSTYSGSSQCIYNPSKKQYNINDAIQTSTYNLLKEIDFDLNGKVDVKFTEQDLKITFSDITGIPFGWSTEVQVRKWH